MVKKRIIIIITGFLILLTINTVRKSQLYYSENEITQNLCRELLGELPGNAKNIEVVDIKKINNTIVAGYLFGGEQQKKEMAFMVFCKTDRGYVFDKVQKHMAVGSVGIGSQILGTLKDDGRYEQYMVVIIDNEKIEKIELLKDKKMAHEILVTTYPYMCFFSLDDYNEYIFVEKGARKIE